MASRILKRGSLGDIRCETDAAGSRIVREFASSRWRWLARYLASREARALERVATIDGLPRLLASDRDHLTRSYLAGQPLHLASPLPPAYFRDALRLLRRLHRAGVAHNDLAKEANWICSANGMPGIVDFQLSFCFDRRTRWFRLLAREDLRHLLKHKRHYRPETITARQRAILETPMWPARWWRRWVKPVYLRLTRGLLGWPERDGAAERQRPE